MNNWLIAIMLKPFFALILFGFIVLPVKLWLFKYIPRGKIRNILYTQLGKKKGELNANP